MTNHEHEQPNRRILIIDDNPSIHADFKKILSGDAGVEGLDAAEADLFGQKRASASRGFELATALQGQ